MKWSELESAFESHKISSLNFCFNLIIDMSASTTITYASFGVPRGFGDLGRMAIYFQGAGEHW